MRLPERAAGRWLGRSRQFLAGTAISLICLVADAPATERASVRTDGLEKHGASSRPNISGDGRLAVFASFAPLVPEDTNQQSDVYVRDFLLGTTVLVSDPAVGGDLPAISNNGRIVAFRSLDPIPKIFAKNLRNGDPLEMVSFPFDTNETRRAAERPVLSSDGRYVAFIQGPANDPLTTNTFSTASYQIILHDRQLAQSDPFSSSVVVAGELPGVGSLTMSGDARIIGFSTKAKLDNSDTNDREDVYIANLTDVLADFGNPSVQAAIEWISHTDSFAPGGGDSFDAAISAQGNQLYFLSTSKLTATDPNDFSLFADIYSADLTQAGSPLTWESQDTLYPAFRASSVSADGSLAAYTDASTSSGKSSKTKVYRLSNGISDIVPLGAKAFAGHSMSRSAVLSASASHIALQSNRTDLVPKDKNKSDDIFVEALSLGAANTLPTVTLSGVSDGDVFAEGGSIALTATASDPDPGGSIFETTILEDGRPLASNSGSPVNTNWTPARGIHRMSASAIDQQHAENSIPDRTVTIAALFGITDATDFASSTLADGATQFSATLRIDKRSAGTSGSLRVLLFQQPYQAFWDNFGNAGDLPAREPALLGTFLLSPATLATGSFAELDVDGVCSASEVFGNGFQGIGWEVAAVLEEFNGTDWVEIDRFPLFRKPPNVNRDTPGPNGGIPTANGSANGTTNGFAVTSITIAGPSPVMVKERGSRRFTCQATLGNASQIACQPKWTVTPNAFAAISSSGVLTTANVPADRNLIITAKYSSGGTEFTDTQEVIVVDVPPKLTVQASGPAMESDPDSASFTVRRTGGAFDPLTFSYEISGTAKPGVDHLLASGQATLFSGSTTMVLPVSPQQDSVFEGMESVILTIIPSPDDSYNTTPLSTARIDLLDDDPVPNGQPDLTVEIKKPHKSVGENIFNDTGDDQSLSVSKKTGQTQVFRIVLTNLGTVSDSFNLLGSGEFAGFGVRYFDEATGTEITAAVIDGSHLISNVPGGATRAIRLEVQVGSDAPLQSSKTTTVLAQSTTAPFRLDAVKTVVKRFK